MYDCIIIGGGPAGLQAALILGRSLRRVVICDSGNQRNRYATAMHAFITRDDIPPEEFLQLAHQDLMKYETVSFIKREVVTAKKIPEGFLVTLIDGQILSSRTLLIATGVMDVLPAIAGFETYYGKNIFNCPYCDAWEYRETSLAVYGTGLRGVEMALGLRKYSQDILLCTDGHALPPETLNHLHEKSIEVISEKIREIEGDKSAFHTIHFENGDSRKRSCLFFNTQSLIRSKLLEELGCPYQQDEGVITEKYEKTQIPGLFVAGNILREVQLVIVAAGQGAEAAFGINKLLNKLVDD